MSKRDWKSGDVRGVRDVSITVPPTALHTSSEIVTMGALLSIFCLLDVFLVLPTVRKDVARRAYFHGLSAELNNKAERLKKEAHTDPLSGLGSRRFFDAAMDRLIVDAAKNGRTVSLAILDADYFKRVNDTFGHDAGDMVIRNLGEMLRLASRPDDVLARIGGEEFAILFPNATSDVAVAKVEQIRAQLAEPRFRVGDAAFSITLNAGVAEVQPGDQPADLFRRADGRLYLAKTTGRDRVCGSSEAVQAP